MRADNSPQNYQSAISALDEFREAMTGGVSIELSPEGNLQATNRSSAPQGLSGFIVYLKNLFGLHSPQEKTKIAAARVAIINKMKVEIYQLVSQKIAEIQDIRKSKTGIPSEQDAYGLQEEIRRVMKEDIQHAQNEFQEIERKIKNGKFNKAAEKWTALYECVDSKSTEKSRELRKELSSDPLGHAEAASVNQIKATAPGEAAYRIDAANRSLPNAMPKIQRTGETICCTLTVPKRRELNMLTSWEQWATHEKHPKEKEPDLFVGLADQFHNDANRITYIFENDDFPIECQRDKDSVALGFKAALKNDLQRMRMLSHAVTQTAFNYIQDTAQAVHKSRNGMPFVLTSGQGVEFNAHRIHMAVEKNGDVSIKYLSYSRCTYLDSEAGTLEINRSEKFQGPPSQENAGICRSMKIRFKNRDLNDGQLRYEVLEPLQLALQVELPHSESEE